MPTNYGYDPSYGSGLGGSVGDVWDILKKFGFQGNNAYGAIRSGMLPGLMSTYYEQTDPTLGAKRAATIAAANEAGATSGRNITNLNEMPTWANDQVIQGQRRNEINKYEMSNKNMDYLSQLMSRLMGRVNTDYRPSQLADWETYDPVQEMLKQLLSAGV